MVPIWYPTELYLDFYIENGTIYGTMVPDLLTNSNQELFSLHYTTFCSLISGTEAVTGV